MSTSNEIQKADQIAFHICTKLLYTVNHARAMPDESKSASRVDKWFNLETPESDLFTREAQRPYRAISQGSDAEPPPPLEIQVLLSVPELTNNQVLVYMAPDSPRVRMDPTPRFVLLETWTLTINPHRSGSASKYQGDAGSDIPIPTTYKHAVVLFRSIFSLLRVLPAWNFCKLLKKTTGGVNRNGHLGIKLRVRLSGDAETVPDVLGFSKCQLGPERSAVSPGCNSLSLPNRLLPPTIDARPSPGYRYPLPTSTHTFSPVEHLLGSFTVSTMYLTTPNFQLDELESFLSARFISLDLEESSSKQDMNRQPQSISGTSLLNSSSNRVISVLSRSLVEGDQWAASFINDDTSKTTIGEHSALAPQVSSIGTPPLTLGTTASTDTNVLVPPSLGSEFVADSYSSGAVSPPKFLGYQFKRWKSGSGAITDKDQRISIRDVETGSRGVGDIDNGRSPMPATMTPRKRYSSNFGHRYHVKNEDRYTREAFGSVPDTIGSNERRAEKDVDDEDENNIPIDVLGEDVNHQAVVKGVKINEKFTLRVSGARNIPFQGKTGLPGHKGINPKEPASHWIAAERASMHVRKNLSQLAKVFEKCNIHESEYAIFTGFDESLIQAGVGYIEQVHIFTVASIDGVSTFLPELGKILSPFSSILFTETTSYRAPVYKGDGSTWDFDELVHFTASKFIDGGSSAETLLTVSIAQNPNSPNLPGGFSNDGDEKQDGEGNGDESAGGGHRGGEDQGRGSGGNGESHSEDGNKANESGEDDQGPDEDPDDPIGRTRESTDPPQVSFNIVSEIYRNEEEGSNPNVLQSLTAEGAFTMQALLDNAAKATSARTVSKILNPVYKVEFWNPTYDREHGNADVSVIKPQQSVAFEREAKELSASKTIWAIGANLGASIGLSPKGNIMATTTRTSEVAASSEKKRYTSRITQQTKYGVVWWGFEIDDPHEQEEGAKLTDPMLPVVEFEFLGDSDIPAPPPENINVEVATYWSIIDNSGQDPNWIHRILSMSASKTGSYSNLCQAVAMVVPSDLKDRADYRATLHVNSGYHSSKYRTQVRRQTGILDVTSAISWGHDTASVATRDLRNQSLLELPTLSQSHRP